MDTVVVIMQKNKKSGFLEKEVASLNIENYESLIVNIFTMEEDDGKNLLHIKVSTDRDVLDWEFSAVFDYYDTEVFGDRVMNVIEIEDSYNPTWELVLEYDNDTIELADKVEDILRCHFNELQDVYDTIKDKESEYLEDEK